MIFNKKTYFFIAIFFLVILSGVIFWYVKTSNQNNPALLNIKYEDYIKNTPFSLAIEKISESNNEMQADQGKPICSAISLWEKDITGIEKIVLASVNCREVLVKNGDLRSASGFNNEPRLYKLQTVDNVWTVIDYDERILLGGTPTKQWIIDYLKLVPVDVKNNFDPIFLDAKLVKKAGEVFNLKTPDYNFNSCTKDNECNSGEICYWHNSGANIGNNKCIKKCSTQQECGVGYTCRRQCVWGENGCPYTSDSVCMPDLLDASLDKTGNPF